MQVFHPLKLIMFLNIFNQQTSEQGARTIVFTAIDQSLENQGGTFITNCKTSRISKRTKNLIDCEKFFKFSCKLLNIKNFGAEYQNEKNKTERENVK